VAVSITICNLALGELRAPAIADIAEDSIEAQNCARYYPQCLKLLLERHDWSFATRIAALAELSDNPRASEWLHAYALPVDCATPKRLVPPAGDAPACWPVEWGQAFIVEAGLLYSQLPGAVLEYSAADIPEAVMPALFADALAFALAARLAVPIRDSREMKGQLLQQAELAVTRAIADDANREPQHDVPFTDEVSMARSVGAIGWMR
jgi:hypothetical protein